MDPLGTKTAGRAKFVDANEVTISVTDFCRSADLSVPDDAAELWIFVGLPWNVFGGCATGAGPGTMGTITAAWSAD